MKLPARLKRPESWLPLAIAGLASVALGFFIGPAFDGDVGAYIQTATTLILVAVTITYVVATQGMAETAQEQLRVTRHARSVDATSQLWRSYCALEASHHLAAVNLRAAVRSAGHGVERWAQHYERTQGPITMLADFCKGARELLPLLPHDVRTATETLTHRYGMLIASTLQLGDLVVDEIQDADRESRAFSREKVQEAWEWINQGSNVLPAYETLGRMESIDATAEAEKAFTIAVDKFIGEHHG